jgi:hypothetical protein
LENNSSTIENITQTSQDIIGNDTTIDGNSSDINLDNQTSLLQNDSISITQLNETLIENNNSSIASENSTQSMVLPLSDANVTSTTGNVAIQADTSSNKKTPSVSYIENEGSQYSSMNYEDNYKESSSNGDHNYDSRDNNRDKKSDKKHDYSSRDSNRDKSADEYAAKELLESDSDYLDYLVMLDQMKNKAEFDKEQESRGTDENPNDYALTNTNRDKEKYIEQDVKEEETIEDIEQDVKEEETIEDIEQDVKEEETIEDIEQDVKEEENNNIPPPVIPVSPPTENDDKIKGSPVDNENKKLLSQFTKVNTSSIIPEQNTSSVIPVQALQNQSVQTIQTQSVNSNKPLQNDKQENKLVANAGLDQILKDENRIVLDASSSFSSDGNITSFSWKQLGDSEEKISPSNSKIYSFPIPQDVEENPLEFELTVMDKNGQTASDIVKVMAADEESMENSNDETEDEGFTEQPAQIQALTEEENDKEDKDEEEGEQSKDDNENNTIQNEDEDEDDDEENNEDEDDENAEDEDDDDDDDD